MGGRSSSSTAQASTNTDRSVVNDEGLVFADAVGMYTQSNSTSTSYTDASDNSSLVLDASVDASDRSLALTTNTATTNSDSRSFTDASDNSLFASDSSNRSFNSSDSRSFTDASDNSLFASDSSNRSFNSSSVDSRSFNSSDSRSFSTNTSDSRNQSLSAWDYSNRADNSSGNNNTTTLDGGAIGGAFKFSADIGNRALASLDSGIARTFGAFDKVIEASSKNTAAAMAENANFRSDVKTAWGTAASEKAGQLDNKTILILGVAVAAMVLLQG